MASFNSPNALVKGIQSIFSKQLRSTPASVVKPFTFMANSKTDKEIYHFIGAMPRVKEWLDAIGFKDFRDFKYEIENKTWEVSTMVDRDHLEDSKEFLGGSLEMNIKGLAKEFVEHPDELIADLLTANGNAFDGTAMFANSRPNIQGTDAIDNLNSGSGVTLANINTDLKTAINQVRAYKDANGKPINRNPKWMIFIPPQLELTFRELANDTQIIISGATTDNVLRGTFEIVVNDFQSSTDNDWYLINVNANLPAFIHQTRKSPVFDVKDDKIKKDILFFATARHNAGYGNPTCILKVDN